MPRDGSNVYSPPAGTTATSGTTIESAKYNAFVADITSDLNAARPVSVGGTGVSTVSAAQTAFKIPPFDGGASISGTWEWQDDVGAVFGNDADASISWVSADSALALKVGATARIEATATGADVTGDLTVSNDLAVTGDVSGATASGAMVSTDMLADKGSTTKVPRVAAVQEFAAAAWVVFTGGATPGILDSKNVSSVSRSATGIYVITLTNAMASADYVVCPSSDTAQIRVSYGANTTTTAKIITEDDSGVNVNAGTAAIVIYGTLA